MTADRSPGAIGRFVRRLSGAGVEARLDGLERLVRKVGDSEREHAAALQHRLAELTQQVAQQPSPKDLRELRQAVRGLAPADDRQTLDELARIATGDRPIVVGPWTGELGFELLYWIPFVQWVRQQWGIAPERQVVVSRGGTASWYGERSAAYADIFSFVAPETFRAAVAEEKRKQRKVGDFDRTIVDSVLRERRLDDPAMLHPRLMYKLFAPYWSDDAGYARVDRFARYRRLDAPPLPAAVAAALPPQYVAVRFYFSECFPATAENRATAAAAVASLAEQTHVVVLNPGFSVDDHSDWVPRLADRVSGIDHLLTPDTNLAVQSAVIAGARAFVGSYGGYAYLPPLHGVPTLALYSRRTFALPHLHAAERAFGRAGAAPFMVVDAGQASLVREALGAATGSVPLQADIAAAPSRSVRLQPGFGPTA